MKNQRMDLTEWSEIQAECAMISMRAGEPVSFLSKSKEYYMMMPVIYCKYSRCVIFFYQCEYCRGHLLDFEYDCCRSCTAPVE